MTAVVVLTPGTSLDLSGTQVTDAGLKSLEPLDKLTSLDLQSTQVTDEGLKALVALPKLTSLKLAQTRVTAKGVADLQKQLPRCKIER